MILRDSLGRYGAKLGLGAGGLLSWWRASLVSWLPARWQALLGWARDRLLLAPEGDGYQLRLERGNEVLDLGHLPLPEAGATDDPLRTGARPPGRRPAALAGVAGRQWACAGGC